MMNYEKLKQNKKILIIISIVIMVVILVLIEYNKNKNYNDIVLNTDIIQNSKTENISDNNFETEKSEEICVHMSGEVVNPGIVILEENCRITDAIEAAGGITEKADISYVNLAFKISDGIKIHIPNINDVEKIKLEYLNDGSGENIVENTSVLTSTNKSKININTATKSELVTLNGIGAATAQKIIEHRELNGKFNSIDEIKNVSGIGNAKFEAIKNYIAIK